MVADTQVISHQILSRVYGSVTEKTMENFEIYLWHLYLKLWRI